MEQIITNYIGLYTIDYRMINNEPVIFLFIRNLDGTKAIKTIKHFKPYCYVSVEALKQKGKCSSILKVEDKIYKTVFGMDVKKCILKKPSDAYYVRKYYEINDVNCYKHIYESDILFSLRYAIDQVGDVQPSNYKVLYYDIETSSIAGFSRAEDPKEFITSISCYDNFSNKIKTFVARHHIGQEVDSLNGQVESFDNDKDMLKAFLKYWGELNPDIVTSWSLFDIKYLIARLKYLEIPYDCLSPINNKNLDIIRDKDTGENTNNSVVIRPKGEIQILGVILLDLLSTYKKLHFNELESYRLDLVAQEELGEEKEKVVNLDEIWEKDINRLVSYNRKDSELLYKIDKKCKLISIFDEIKRYSGVRDILDCNFASRIHETKLMRYHRDKVFPTKSPYNRTEESRIQGALVREPIPGRYKNILCLDMKGLYPNLIFSFNLSKEMISETEGNLINGIHIRQEPKGIMATMIMELLALKSKMKKEVAGTGQDLSDKMFAVKTFINSYYGVNLLSSFRLFDRRIGSTITFLGREFNKKIGEVIEKEFGYKVLYGDTDSIFYQLPESFDTTEKMVVEGKKIQNRINDLLPKFVEDLGGVAKGSTLFIEFEKICNPIIFQFKKAGKYDKGARKKYAGWIVWEDDKLVDKIKIAGMDSRRSNVSHISKIMQKELFNKLLHFASKEECVDYVKSIIDKILSKQMNPEDLAMPQKLEHDVEDYKANMPKLRGVEWSNKNLKTQFRAGVKFKMIYVKHPETDVICFEDKEQLENSNIQIDYEKVIEKDIFQKIDAIFKTMKWQDDYEQLNYYVSNKLSGQKTLF